MKQFTKLQLKYFALNSLIISSIIGGVFFSDLVFIESVSKGGGFIAFLLALGMILGASALLFGIFFLKWTYTKYKQTESSIVMKRLLKRKEVEMKYSDVQSVEVKQNIIQKLFKIGYVVLDGKNSLNKKELFVLVEEINQAKIVAKKIKQHIDN